MNDPLKYEWFDRIRGETVGQEALLSISEDVNRSIQSILHIVSVGNRWIVEEVVFLLSLRISIELSMDVLDFMGYALEINQLENADTALVEMARSKINRHAFRSSASMIKKNWNIRSVWLEAHN